MPASVATGTHHVVVCADTGRAVKERKESNNCKGSKGTVTVTPTGPPKQVTISWTVAPVPLVSGSVSGQATNGTCSTDLTGGGSCVVTAGVGTVTLTATPPPLPLPLLPFKDWSGASCTSTANPLVITSPSTNIACTANFGP